MHDIMTCIFQYKCTSDNPDMLLFILIHW